MDFAVLFEAQVAYPTREHEQEVIRGGVEQAMLADRLGFDRFYCVEHHTLEGYSHSSAPEVMLSFVAARTERIRVAHGVVCLPYKMNHPVRVAERTAMLDILSGGRLDVGFGRSSSKREQGAFNIDDADTHQEFLDGMAAVVRMWTEDELEIHSDTLEMPLRTVRPRPVQDPHPPLSMACTRESSFEIAGRLGLGALSNAADGPNQAKKKRAIYDAARAGRKPGDLVGMFENNHLGATVFTCVRDDRDEARRLGLRGMRYFLEAARRWFVGGDAPDPDSWKDEDIIPALREMFEASAGTGSFSKTAYEADNRPPATKSENEIVGVGLANKAFNPDDVLDSRSQAMGNAADTIEFVEAMADAGVDECYFVVQTGGLPHDVVMESIRQIGENVIPHFRKPAPTVVAMS